MPIWEFRTLKELIGAFINYIEGIKASILHFLLLICYYLTAHSDLYFLAKILHRDISLWNLMLKDNKTLKQPNGQCHRGLLIDLDYAQLTKYLHLLGVDWDIAGKEFLFP